MKYLLTILLSFVLLIGKAQTGQADSVYSNNAENQATTMAKLLLAKDYNGFIKYTYKPVVDMAGGEEKMLELIKAGIDEIEAQGFSILNFSVTKPGHIVHLKNQLQCVLGQTIEMKIPNGRLVTNSSLIGISNDNGKNWTFIDTHGKDLKTLKVTLPVLSNNLVIPVPEEPVVYKD